MRISFSIVLLSIVGMIVAAPPDASSLASSNTPSQKQTGPPVADKKQSDVDYKIPSPTIVLKSIAKPKAVNGKLYYETAFEVTNSKDYPTGVFVEVTNPKLPFQCTKSDKSFRLFAQIFDENRKVMGWNCGVDMASQEALKGPVVMIPAKPGLPKSAFLLLTDVKTGKQYKSNVVPIAGVQPN